MKNEHPLIRKQREKNADTRYKNRLSKEARKAKNEQLTPDEIRYVQELVANPRVSRGEIAQRLGLQSIPSRPTVNKFIAEEVGAAREECLANIKLDLPRVILEVMRLALVDLGDAFDDDGNLLPLSAMAEDVRRALTGIDTQELFQRGKGGEKVLEGYARKIKTDKVKSLELLLKYLGAFDGQGREQKDRLGELMSVFQAGPVKKSEVQS